MPPDVKPYDPREYWTRLHAVESLQSVGQSGLPPEFNDWLYRIGRRNVQSFLARNGLRSLDGWRVFDVGAGTGYWTGLWYQMGASRVDGCDLIDRAVERLRERFPKSTFIVGDVADPTTMPSEKDYQLVTVMNVMLHIVDEARFDAAGAAIASAVSPGGWLFLAEPALRLADSAPAPAPGASSVARPLARYRAAFEAAGLDLAAIGASAVVAANPIERADPHYRLYARLWSGIGRLARRGPIRAALAGRVLSALDRLLMPMGVAPSGKLMLFKRSG